MPKRFQDNDLRFFLGNVLRYGVFTSLGIVVIGLILYLIQNGAGHVDYSRFTQKDFDFSTFWSGIWHGDSFSVMAAGVLLLILTPILRVIFAIVGFFWEKDKLYTIVSTIVLLIIIVSTILGAVS